MRAFHGRTADDVWIQATEALRDTGSAQRSRAGETDELLHCLFTISDPRHRWVRVRNPPMSVAFAIAEVIWIVSGRNDAAFVTFWNSKLPQYSGTGETFHGAYGYRLRNLLGLDQLERAYVILSKNPDSRQVVLQIWDAKLDLPSDDGQPVYTDIPCNTMSLLKIRSGKLHWSQILRSNDIHRGVPYNFVQFMFLQEIIAGWLGLDLGEYSHFSDSLHVYRETREATFSLFPNSTPLHEPDDYRLPKQESDHVFSLLERALDKLRSPITAGEIKQVADTPLPRAYRNLLLVCTAEAARRHGYSAEAINLLAECTNPLLRSLLDSWFSRVGLNAM
jgi:thymidylate synthase